MDQIRELTYEFEQTPTAQQSLESIDFQINCLKQQITIENYELTIARGERDCLRRRVEGYEKLTAVLAAKVDTLTEQLDSVIKQKQAA